MRTLVQDIRFGFRLLAANPGFTAVAVLTLAVGIASTTTVFTWIDSTLLRPFHGANAPSELAALESVTPGAPNGGTAVSWLDFKDYRDNLTLLSGLLIRRQCAFTIGEPDDSQLAWGEIVSGNYFDVLGIRPVLGRMFSPNEQSDTFGASPVAVISHRLWRVRFKSDPAIIGKILRVNRRPLAIVGVAPPDFHGSVSVMLFDFWTPVTMGAELGVLTPDTFKERDNRMFDTIARRRPGVSIAQARAEVTTLAEHLAVTYPKTNRRVTATLLPPSELHDGIHEYLGAPLRILMVVSLVVLLIVCANVANLLLARSIHRQREFAIRLALGAGRARVVRQLLTETLLLSAAGAVLGFPLMLWMLGAITALVPSVGLPIASGAPLNPRIFAFAALVSVTAALIAGAAPALFSLRAEVNESLKEGGRSGTPGSTSRRTRGMLVIAEVALAAVALIGAGLFVRSFRNALAIHPGFDASHVLFGRFFIESASFTRDQAHQFTLRLRHRLESNGGIESVSYSDFVPLSTTGGPYNTVQVDGYQPAPGEFTTVNRSMVGPSYFSTLRIPLLAGRDFNDLDDPASPPVMIVNEAFARRFFGGAQPVGRRVRAMGKWFDVIGLARDCKYFHPAETARPFFYIAFRQFYSPTPELYLFMRTTGDPVQAIGTLRRAVNETNPDAAGFHAVSLAEYTQVALFGQKVAASLMAALGLMCLLLAALGLYSVMSYSVNQRSHEIGIRMAMGARPADVTGMVVREGIRLAAIGLVIGTTVGLAVTRFLAGMLIRVDTFDPVSFAAAVVFLGAVALLAAWLPARRATRIDPMTALRD